MENVKRTPKSRLFINGRRMLEGRNCDWYREEDKIVVVWHNLQQSDVVIMEYPDFSEEVLRVDSLWHTCRDCPIPVPSLERRCRYL